MPRRTRSFITVAAAMVTLTAATLTTAVPAVHAVPAEDAEPAAAVELLTDPFLQVPTDTSVNVVWFTEFPGSQHSVLVGNGVDDLVGKPLAQAVHKRNSSDIRAVRATTTRLSRAAEDASSNLPEGEKPVPEQGIVDRPIWRHEAVVAGLEPGEQIPYRVVSLRGQEFAASATFTLQPAPAPGDGTKILLTSDHQAMVNTPANLQLAAATVGDIDAVFVAGDLVNIPDRASEWFDDTRGSAFFPVLQGTGGRASTSGTVYKGAPIIQNAPLFTAIGNHEVQGRRDGATSLGQSFNSPVPREVAEAEYQTVAAEVNPTGDPAVKAAWIEDNSFSTRTYEEIFTLPASESGGETYYATTFGDVRLVSLYSTRIWRGTTANLDPAVRTATSRYQEAAANLGDPLAQGYGEHIFEAIDASSEQYAWLQQELASDEFQDARYKVVILHEGPQGLGDNVMPQFADPQRIEERDATGTTVGVRCEYPATENELLYDLQPLLEGAGVDLVQNGHSHLWNRFVSENGVTNWIETSNTGNSYGAYHPLSGRSRPVPPAPWEAANYWAQGNPGGLEPILPTRNPFIAADGTPQPFVQSNDHAVFTVLDTATGAVTSYSANVTAGEQPVLLDRFTIGG